jgi:OFA family oxalate/formate antiporter-like MFS transporter
MLSAGDNWDRVFIVTAAITIAAAISAKFVLAPMRRRCIAEANSNPSRLAPRAAEYRLPNIVPSSSRRFFS